MPEMDSENIKTDMDAMDIDVVYDASNDSKRVKRSSAGNDSVQHPAWEDDLVKEIGTLSPDLGMRAWKPMNGHRGNFSKGNSTNLIWQPKSSSFTSNSLEKGFSIVAQKRFGKENGRDEVIVSPDEGNYFPLQRNDMRIKGKEVESKGNPTQNFPVMGPSISNRSMMRQPDEIACSSKKDKEVYSYFDTDLKSRMKGNRIACGRDPQCKVDEVLPKPSYLYSSGMNTGWANGISKEPVEKTVYIDLSEGVSSHELNSSRLHSHKKKGQLTLKDDTSKDMRHGEPTIQSSRAASLFGKEVVTIAEEQGSSFESYQNLGWRKAHDLKINMNQLSHAYPSNHKEKLSSSYFPKWRQVTAIKDEDHANVICKSPQIITQDDISNPHHDQAYPDPVVSRRNHHWKKHVKGKKKCNSLLSNFGETSGTISNESLYPQSHAGTSNFNLDKSNTNRCHGTTLIEIDKLYPEARCYNSHGQQCGVSDNSSASASQIESDEIFARELQEQFYHESTRCIEMEKVDATIALSLQQDEDDNAKAAALAWRGHSNSVLFDEIRSNFNGEVDLETRLDLLEAMEDLLENNDMLEYGDLASNYSFNDTDYEMQLEIDESNHQHVSSSEINNLPLSLIQNDNNREACAVCLEIPSIGETMRHLPCLHKFHKMCIDTWLKRKPSCPVCKFNIT